MRNAFMSVAVIAVALVAAPAFAQQESLTAQEQSVVMVEIDFTKILDSELGKLMDFEGKLKSMPTGGDEDFDPADMSKMTAAMSLPDNIAAFQTIGPGSDLPMELFSTMTFKTAASAEAAFTKMKEKAEEVQVGGKTYFKPNDPSSPGGLLAAREGDSSLMMGSEKYISRSDRQYATAGLKSAWEKMPEDAVRIAIDVEGMPALKEEIIEMIGTTAPNFAAYGDLLNNISNLRITMDIEGENLLTICATGKDKEMAEEFAEGLDSLLGMGKMGISMQANSIPDDKAKGVIMAIAESLNANVDGTEVRVIIPRPEGFNEAIQGMLPPGF